MKVRKLEPSEYPLLELVHEGFRPDPDMSIALVVEKDNDIVGRVFLLAPAHIEGPWVREDLRGGYVGKLLIDAAEKEARLRGITRLFAYAVDGQIENYLERLGFEKSPMTVWTKELCLH